MNIIDVVIPNILRYNRHKHLPQVAGSFQSAYCLDFSVKLHPIIWNEILFTFRTEKMCNKI